ncbi:unnamed protein product [Mucor hiemalis]
MDGNFQLKRRSRITSSKEILGVPNSVTRLWGTVEDVEKYTLPNNEYNKSDCPSEDFDSDLKAARNGNRKLGGRFDENGVFALCCGRHGIPNTMYDIFGGEG